MNLTDYYHAVAELERHVKYAIETDSSNKELFSYLLSAMQFALRTIEHLTGDKARLEVALQASEQMAKDSIEQVRLLSDLLKEKGSRAND